MKNGPYTLKIAPPEYPGRKYRGRYCYEHHLVWWLNTGSLVPLGMEIHHRNGDHRDNRIKNLELLTGEEHRKKHGVIRTKEATIGIVCGHCRKKFSLLKSVIKSRKAAAKFGIIFCSRSCGTKHNSSIPQ